ncbi:hypothetical protein T439DRAFT_380596 [Meredithblackwellia eburnea MCA 4105]
MATPTSSSTAKLDATSTPSSPATSLSQLNSAKRSLRAVASKDTFLDPLLSSPDAYEIVSGSSTGPYPVYTGGSKTSKRLSFAGSDSPTPLSSTAVTPSTPPQAAPTSPSIPTSLPPLVSRPSSAPLPTVVRPPARSISEATRSLLSQNLKADIQSLGLAPDTAGSSMVSKISGLGSQPEWTGILKAIASGKATLLLPAEKLPAPAFMTPAFFLDHLAVVEPPPASTSTRSPPPRSFATLSGFRGLISGDTVTIYSCGSAIAETQSGLFKPGSLAAPPFAESDFHVAVSGHSPPSAIPSTSVAFPSLTLISPFSELSIHRSSSRPSQSTTPERRIESIGRAAGATGSRLAALFAGKGATAPNDDLPPMVPAPPGLLSSESTSEPDSTFTLQSGGRSSSPNVDVPVVAISQLVRHSEVVKGVAQSLEAHFRDTLREFDGIDESSTIPNLVCAFVTRFQPPLGWTTSLSIPGRFPAPADSLFTKDVEDISDAFQKLLSSARNDLLRGIRQASASDRERADPSKPMISEEAASRLIEERVDASLERLEELVTVTLYDRIFCPTSSGDAQEDENLASRIAALNILELSLVHLGIDVRPEEDSEQWDSSSRATTENLEQIITAAGLELARLQDSSTRSPSDKLAVMVNVHKIIVEGLSKLPPIPLKETAGASPFISRQANEGSEIEMDDASSRTSRKSTTQTDSPSPIEDSDDSEQKTPRPDSHAGTFGNVADLHLPPSARSSAVFVKAQASPAPDFASSMMEATGGSVFDTHGKSESEKPAGPTSSSADLILPLLIYLVVQSNPPRLPSTLLYLQRFRTESLARGEASYCATNFHAVQEFLNSVDIAALGLSSQNIKGMSPYSPIIASSTSISNPNGTASSSLAAAAKLKGRVTTVTHELDNFVDSANSALVNVVDSSFRMLFGPKGLVTPRTIDDVKNALDGATGGKAASSAGTGLRSTLLRRSASQQSGFFGASNNSGVTSEDSSLKQSKEMVDISSTSNSSATDELESVSREEADDDAMSIKSVRSVTAREREKSVGGGDDGRPSIGERLASIASLRASSASVGVADSAKSSTGSSTPQRRGTQSSIVPLIVSVQVQSKFLDRDAADLRMSEVGELLEEYKKLAREFAKLTNN